MLERINETLQKSNPLTRVGDRISNLLHLSRITNRADVFKPESDCFLTELNLRKYELALKSLAHLSYKLCPQPKAPEPVLHAFSETQQPNSDPIPQTKSTSLTL